MQTGNSPSLSGIGFFLGSLPSGRSADSYKNGNDQIVPVLMYIPCDRAVFPAADKTSLRRVCDAVRHLGEARTRGDLGETVAREVEMFSLAELQAIGGSIRNEVDKLPSPYREKIRPYFHEQFFGTHHRLLCMFRSGAFSRMDEPITDPGTFRKFVAMVPEGCFGDPADSGTEFLFGEPGLSLFYYLLSGFAMFVLDEPGHPVGTPFPGGFVVERRGAEFFCPIRDKEEDIPFSICNFCPAKQMEGV